MILLMPTSATESRSVRASSCESHSARHSCGWNIQYQQVKDIPERWNITLNSFDHHHHNSPCIFVKIYSFLVDLDEEEEDGKVGGDGDSNVQLHCLHLDHHMIIIVLVEYG